MKSNILTLLVAGGLLTLVAWMVYAPNQAASLRDPSAKAQSDKLPEKYNDTVRKGLEYLAKNQHKDGHWEGDNGQHPVAMTGLAGLALLVEKDYLFFGGARVGRGREAKYSANLRKAADWLMDKSNAGRDGLIFSEHPSESARYMQGHGLATLFLAGMCVDEQDDARRKKLYDVVTRAVSYITRAQSTQGGWHHTSKVEGHDFASISATAIQVQALLAAENAGVPTRDAAIHDAREYLKMALAKDEAAKRNRAADTAAALACLVQYRQEKDDSHKKWFKNCETVGRNIQLDRDELIHYYYAQAEFYLGGDTWTSYRTQLFDHLQSSQHKDGSWPACDGIGVGRVYSTAVWCTVLQLDKGSHPSITRIPERVK